MSNLLRHELPKNEQKMLDDLDDHYLLCCEIYINNDAAEENDRAIFNEFKRKYLDSFGFPFFKNFLSRMRLGLLDGSIATLEAVQLYCIHHPQSRSAVILNEIYGITNASITPSY